MQRGRLLRTYGRRRRRHSVHSGRNCLFQRARWRRLRARRLRYGCGILRCFGRSVLWRRRRRRRGHLHRRESGLRYWRWRGKLRRLWCLGRALLRDYREPDLHRRGHDLQRKHGRIYLRRLRCHWRTLLSGARRERHLHSLQCGMQSERRCRWRSANAHLRGLWNCRQSLLPGQCLHHQRRLLRARLGRHQHLRGNWLQLPEQHRGLPGRSLRR